MHFVCDFMLLFTFQTQMLKASEDEIKAILLGILLLRRCGKQCEEMGQSLERHDMSTD